MINIQQRAATTAPHPSTDEPSGLPNFKSTEVR